MAERILVPAQTRSLAGAGRPARGGFGARAARRKFLRFFPGGFRDRTYLAWERDYKWAAHQTWVAALNREEFGRLLARRAYRDIAAIAIRMESRTNLLFSFEKMALRDAVRPAAGARAFAVGLYDLVYGEAAEGERFDRWCAVLAALPRVQTRVLTWPVATVFPFLARPRTHFFLKPVVTRTAAARYGYDLAYRSRPSWATYDGVLEFARAVRRDLRDLEPRDMIDLQSFLWVLGSDEYDE